MGGYWRERHELEPEVTDQETRRAWVDDRDRFLTFLVNVEASAVLGDLEALLEGLNRFECTRVAPPRYLHITLKQVGFRTPEASDPDEVPPTAVDEIADRAAAVLSDVEPFSVRLPRLNLFPRVVYCEVDADGRLESIHRSLLELPQVPEHRYDGDSYTPHTTLCSFRDTADFPAVVDWLEERRTEPEGTMHVDRVDLVEVDPRPFFPAFRPIRQYTLDG